MSGEGKNYENPIHEVHIGYNFAVGKYEVTQDEWVAVMGWNPSRFKGGRHPVESISWDDAKAFLAKLSAKTGKKYRLLSESEWEYVAWAGSDSKYPWGNGTNASKENNNNETVPVGSYGANNFGLHGTASCFFGQQVISASWTWVI